MNFVTRDPSKTLESHIRCLSSKTVENNRDGGQCQAQILRNVEANVQQYHIWQFLANVSLRSLLVKIMMGFFGPPGRSESLLFM